MTIDWNENKNFSSYDQVEAPDNYRSVEEMDSYRRERLAFCGLRAEFLLTGCGATVPVDVVEVGAGSSALLYSLSNLGMLKSGVAIELSESRHRFAERWREDKDFQNIVNHCADFAQIKHEPKSKDIFVCIDNTFSLIGPENAAYPQRLVDLAFDALRPGGSIVIEIHNQEKVFAAMHEDQRQLWIELPETNAFKFALYRQTRNRTKNLILSETIYLRRDGAERRKADMEIAYTRPMLEVLLRDVGFADFQFMGGYDGAEFDPAKSEYLIVVARKPAH